MHKGILFSTVVGVLVVCIALSIPASIVVFQGEGEERLTLITQRKDQRLLVQTERIPVREARTLLAETDQVSPS